MASSASSRGIAAIVGVGPNLGRSIARKFAHEGYTVAILARDLGNLTSFHSFYFAIRDLNFAVPYKVSCMLLHNFNFLIAMALNV